MRRSSTNLDNDFDIYLYDVGDSLNCVAGLGRDGYFHHWSGSFTSTVISYTLDTWYLVTIEFNCTTNLYNFVVYNESMQEVVRRNALSFGNVANSTAINRGMLYTGSTFVGNAYADDYRVYRWPGADITSSVGSEIPNPLPVELNSFSASIIGSKVKLIWRTETEVNNYGFEVERQIHNGQSSIGNFEKIGFANGNGNCKFTKKLFIHRFKSYWRK